MKKRALAAGASLFFLVVVYFTLTSLVNVAAIKERLTQSVHDTTGLETVILGGSDKHLFPPHVTIHQVAVRNVPGSLNPYMLTAENVEIDFPFSSLFSSQKTIVGMRLSGVQLVVEEMRDGTRNLDKITLPKTAMEAGVPVRFSIAHGTIKHGGFNQPDTVLATDMSGSFAMQGKQIDAELLGKYLEKPVTFSWHPVTADTVKLNVSDGNNTSLGYEGKIALFPLSLEGKFALESANIMPALNYLLPVPASSAPAEAIVKDPLPFKLQGAVTWTPDSFALSQLVSQTDALKGGMDLVARKDPDSWRGQGTVNLERIDFDTLSKTGALHVLATLGSNPQGSVMSAQGTTGGWMSGKDISFTLAAKSMVANQQNISDIQITGSASGGDVVIEQAKALLPGNGELVTVGLVKSGFQGITYEGTVDVTGQDFTAAAPAFGLPIAGLPKEDFRRFHAKGNLIMSPQEIRFTESGVQIEGIRVLGAWLLNLANPMTLDAAINISGLNIDHLLAVSPASAWVPILTAEGAASQPSTGAQWLNGLTGLYRIKGSLENYIFHAQPREKLDFGLEFGKGKIVLNPISTRFNNSSITGSAIIDTSAAKPAITLKMACDNMDINSFFGIAMPEKKKTAVGERWSKEEFNLQPLALASGTFDFTFGGLSYNGTTMKNIVASGTLGENGLEFTGFHANVFGADLRAKGKLGVGKLSSLSAAFNLSDIAAEQLNNFLPVFSNMVGRFNVVGSLTTSGINPYSWASNSIGNVSIAASDVVVKGFNLPGIVRSISAVRSTADIINIVRLAFPGGDTQLNMKGTYNLTQGVLDTPGIDLSSTVATGRLSGKVNLVDWTLDTTAMFTLSTLSAQKPPVLTLQISGNLDDPRLGLDTRSLEEYVAMKSREKLLQELP